MRYCRQGEENCGEKSGGRNVDQMGKVLRKRDVSLIIIMHINFLLSYFICTMACKCENTYCSHFTEAN